MSYTTPNDFIVREGEKNFLTTLTTDYKTK